MKPMFIRLLVILPCLYWSNVFADVDSKGATDPLFTSDDILVVRIVAAFDDVMGERNDDNYFPGKFQFESSSGEAIELDVGVRARGLFRRNPDVCLFPPLRLKFKKSQVKNTLFAGQDKLKLVTHCRPRSFAYEQAVISEYLAYRILNLLSDTSFRVRLLRIEYANTDGDASVSSYGFFIEHKDRLGKRIGLPPLDIIATSVASLEPEYLNLSSVFQYLIGNTDFAQTSGPEGEECCHNHVLFGAEGSLYYSIPYDFDMAGMVGAPHAIPNSKLRLSDVKERLYRGRCVNNELLSQTFRKVVDARPEIEAIVTDQEELASSTRRDILLYFRKFFKTISSERAVNRHFVKRCN